MAQQQSLFGPSIYDVQQQQMQQDQELAMRQAQLGAGQGLMYQAASAGQRAGRSIAGLFGVEDPKLKEASARQELKNAISAQWDGQDPVEAYKIMAREAARLGLTQEAIAAAAQVKAAEESALDKEQKRIRQTYEIGKLAAQTQEALRKADQAKTAKIPSLVQLQDARDSLDEALQTEQDPQKRTMLETRRNELNNAITKESTREPKEKTPPSVGSDREAIAQEIYNKGFYELTPDQKAIVNKRDAELAKGKQTINVDARQAQGVNAAQVKRFDDISNNAIAAEKSISNIEAMSRTLNNAFTGVGSDVALKVGQIANALGVQVTGTTETEQLKQLIANLTASQARNLPGSLSEKELMFLKEAIGNTGMTKQTLNSMLKRMRTEALTDKKAYEDVFQYQLSGNDLNKYDFVSNRSKARKEAQRISELLDKATPEQRRQLGY